LAIIFAAACLAQTYAPGPQVVTFWSNVDDSDQPYGLYLPKNFDSAKQYPLVISLHGSFSNHRLNLRRVFGEGNRLHESDAEASRYFPRLKDVDFIVASPFARGTMGYQGIAEKDVYDVLADVKRKFHIDEDRVYLTGLSMGGGGTLWLGLTRPDLWAAMAPVCAAAPAGTEDFAPNALNLPVHLFHGEVDPVVPVEISRQWQKRLLDLGAKAEYVEFPGVKHNSWDYAYKDAAIFDWFAKFRRVRYPDRIRFVSSAFKYNSAYWVALDGLTPGAEASIDAKFTGINQLEITTNNLDAFTLSLVQHPKYSPARPVSIGIDGQILKLKPRDALSFSKKDNGWIASRFEPQPGDKRPGAEGPLSEAIASRHVYIYGTGGTPAAEELQTRRETAEHAADWTGMAGRLAASLPVHADKQMEDIEAECGNLILFGTKETNSVIARLASHLPMELNAGAADYGLVFVAAAGNHHVLVNSGLPWWTGAEHVKAPHFEFIRPPATVLTRFGDYVLFKGSLENVVAEGRFDKHWKLTAADSEKMKATGAVVIK